MLEECVTRFFRVAPFDTTVFLTTILYILALGFFVIRSTLEYANRGTIERFDLGASLILGIVVAFSWARSVKGYRLAGDEIVVERAGPGKMRIPLESITSADIGQDLGSFMKASYLSLQGLFGWAGRVSVRKPADIQATPARAYGTNPAFAVVLEMGDGRRVILTPADKEGFTAALREAGVEGKETASAKANTWKAAGRPRAKKKR